MKKLLVLTLALSAPTVVADLPWEPAWTWVMPTFYVSGAPLPLDEIAESRLYCDGATTPDFVIPAPTIEFLTPFKYFGAGGHACYMTVVDITGSESGPSGVINFTVSADEALPPVLNVN